MRRRVAEHPGDHPPYRVAVPGKKREATMEGHAGRAAGWLPNRVNRFTFPPFVTTWCRAFGRAPLGGEVVRYVRSEFFANRSV